MDEPIYCRGDFLIQFENDLIICYLSQYGWCYPFSQPFHCGVVERAQEQPSFLFCCCSPLAIKPILEPFEMIVKGLRLVMVVDSVERHDARGQS